MLGPRSDSPPALTARSETLLLVAAGQASWVCRVGPRHL
jgi:hypothetical protein